MFAVQPDLHQQEQVITRDLLRNLTGLKMSIIDDHVGRMIENGRLRRLRAGVFVPIDSAPPPRPVSLMMMPGGASKMEIGDICVDLWPSERRMLASILVGDAVQYSNLQAAHDANFAVGTTWEELKKLKRDLGGGVRRCRRVPSGALKLLRFWRPFQTGKSGARLGLHPTTVRLQRVRLGRASWESGRAAVPWTPEALAQLGAMSDSQLARRLNVDRGTVWAKRQSLGIPSVSPKPRWQWTDAQVTLLGTASDAAVASQIGCSDGQVSYERRRRGIPLFRPARWADAVL